MPSTGILPTGQAGIELRAVPLGHRVAEGDIQEEWARVSRVATMLRAQKLALVFEGDDASGWAASVLEATAQSRVTGVVGRRRDPRRRSRRCLEAPYRVELGSAMFDGCRSWVTDLLSNGSRTK